MDDALARTCAAVFLAAAALAMLVGGFFTPAGGAWTDGGRRIALRQLGCYLRGHARVAGGLQIFRGYALFGWVRLWRNDYGTRHLQQLGFTAAQATALDGHVTGSFAFRLQPRGASPQRLQGHFHGKKFSFAGERLTTSGYAAAEPRTWGRPPAEAPS